MKPIQNSFLSLLIRVSAFLLKEIFEIMRQPMLLVTLVLGPFLILFFFGIGFRNEPRALRTMFVVEEDSPLAQTVQTYAGSLGPQLIFSGVTGELAVAQERLQKGEIDLIAVIPSDPYSVIRGNNQAVFDLYHREIDPFQSDYIRVFGRVYVDEVNRRILRFITSAGQLDVSKVDEKLEVVHDSIDVLKKGLQDCADALTELGENRNCNSNVLQEYARELDHNVDEMQLQLGDDANLSDAAQRWFEGDTSSNLDKELEPTLNRIVRNTNEIGDFEEASERAETYLSQIELLTKLEADLAAVQERLQEFGNIDPEILVSPFRSDIFNLAAIAPQVTYYYAPAVIVMLLQHLTVTFAALSLVRERLLGSMELFNVSPISALETLLGKYLSYLLFGSVLAVVLFSLIIAGMGVPMLGGWSAIALTVLALIFTSLGIGFIISLISSTDTQAVQYAMIVLLTSVFFSGFILELHTLWQPVRLISWSLPATYGILLLRDVMLRGSSANPMLMLRFAVMGLILFIIAWFLLRRSMARI
jgi:ABC-2 type transport system permease protein